MKTTQYQYLINLLRERGEEGINSFERFNGRIKIGQLPARIYYLERFPYNLRITHKDMPDTSMTYILESEPPKLTEDDFIFKNGTAYLKEEPK